MYYLLVLDQINQTWIWLLIACGFTFRLKLIGHLILYKKSASKPMSQCLSNMRKHRYHSL